MFNVFSYRRYKVAGMADGRLGQLKLVESFDDLRVARVFIEDKSNLFVQYPKNIQEKQA